MVQFHLEFHPIVRRYKEGWQAYILTYLVTKVLTKYWEELDLSTNVLMFVSCSGDCILHRCGEQFLSPAGPQAGCAMRWQNSTDRICHRPTAAAAATWSAPTPLPKASVSRFKQQDYIGFKRNKHNVHSTDIGAWFLEVI